jgi:hypothetical protein
MSWQHRLPVTPNNLGRNQRGVHTRDARWILLMNVNSWKSRRKSPNEMPSHHTYKLCGFSELWYRTRSLLSPGSAIPRRSLNCADHDDQRGCDCFSGRSSFSRTCCWRFESVEKTGRHKNEVDPERQRMILHCGVAVERITIEQDWLWQRASCAVFGSIEGSGR